MIEMASWGGSDLKNLQFLVPKVCICQSFVHKIKLSDDYELNLIYPRKIGNWWKSETHKWAIWTFEKFIRRISSNKVQKMALLTEILLGEAKR